MKTTDDFYQPLLTVSGNSDNSEYLSLTDRKTEIGQHLIGQTIDSKHNLFRLQGLPVHSQQNITPHHPFGKIRSGVDGIGIHLIHHSPFSENGDFIGNGHHLGQFVADKHDGLSLLNHLSKGFKKLLRLLECQNRGRLVKYQNSALAVEQF